MRNTAVKSRCGFQGFLLATAWAALSVLPRAGAAEPPVTGKEWEKADIGEVAEEGSLKVEGSAVSLTGLGRMAPWAKDALFFAYREFTGDFSIQAKVESLEGPADQSAVVLMARDGLDADAPFAAVSLRKRHGLLACWRESAGANLSEKRVWGPTPPLWIRLERVGNEFRTFSSAEGGDWKELHFQEVNLPETLLIGLGVLSASSSNPATAVFEEIEISRP